MASIKKRIFKTGAIALAVVLAALLLLMARLGTTIRTAVNRLGPSFLGVPVSVETVSVHPLRGTFSLKNLEIGNPEGYSSEYLFRLDEARLELFVKELLRGDVHFKEIVIYGPQVWYDRKLTRSNVSDLLANLEKAEEKEQQEKPAKKDREKKSVVIDYFEMKSGTVGVKAGLGMKLPLPSIDLRNIGRDKALMPAQVVRLIFVNIFKGVLGAVTAAGDLAIDGVKESGKLAVEGIKGGGKLAVEGVRGAGKAVSSAAAGIGGIFKGKQAETVEQAEPSEQTDE